MPTKYAPSDNSCSTMTAERSLHTKLLRWYPFISNVLDCLLHKSLERQLSNQKFCTLLIAPFITQGNGTRSVSVTSSVGRNVSAITIIISVSNLYL